MSVKPSATRDGGAGWTVVLSAIPRTGFAFAVVALVGLVLVVLWEVAARRIFNAPTIWAFDLAGYLQAAGFLLVAGELLRRGEHIKIDVFSKMLPGRMRAVIDLLVMAVLVIASGWLAIVAGKQALHAWNTAQVDWVSVWAPKVWPYYTIVTFAMLSLFLGALGRVIQSARSVRAGEQ